MSGRSTLLAALLLMGTAGSGHLAAQTTPAARADTDALRRQIERRFDVLPLTDGIALRPKTPISGVRSIEITNGTIAIDGSPVTGSELRTRVGDAADPVLQVSYLATDAQRALLGAAPALPVMPAVPSVTQPDVPAILPPAPVEAEPRRRSRTREWDSGNDRVRIGGSVRIDAGDVVDGDVAAIGGSAHVDGTVRGEVVAIGGNVDLGPQAVVEGDVTVIGGRLNRPDTARVNGEVREVGFGAWRGDWNVPRSWLRWSTDGFGSTVAFFSTLTRGAVVSLLAALVVLLAGTHVERVRTRAVAETLKAGAIGFLAQLLFLPLLIITIVVLVVTLVGIPLLALIPFALLGLGVVGLLGFTAVAREVGIRVGQRLGWVNPSPYVTTFAGIVTIMLPVLMARLALMAGGTGVSALWHLLAFVGYCLEYVVWTVGFGAVALVRFGRTQFSSDSSQLSARPAES